MKYDWKDAGEEWSAPWGNSAAQWAEAIFPRIRDCLPAQTILEIGSGFGRWTQYLKEHCRELWAIDRAERCVEECRRRFAGDAHVRCVVNDGCSLSILPDAAVDFVFSFDTFVHARPEVVEANLRELGTKLKIGGKGFIHHSNFGDYSKSLFYRVPPAVNKILRKMRIADWTFNRDPIMNAQMFRQLCERHGLHCLSQELINWRGRRLLDCLSIFVRDVSPPAKPTQIIRNPNFMREAARIRRHYSVRNA